MPFFCELSIFLFQYNLPFSYIYKVIGQIILFTTHANREGNFFSKFNIDGFIFQIPLCNRLFQNFIFTSTMIKFQISTARSVCRLNGQIFPIRSIKTFFRYLRQTLRLRVLRFQRIACVVCAKSLNKTGRKWFFH